MARLAGRTGMTEGQAYTLVIGLVFALVTAGIGIPPTLRDRITERIAEVAAPVDAAPPAAGAAAPSSPAPAPLAAAPVVQPAGASSFEVAPSAAPYSDPAPSGPSYADGGSLGDVEVVATVAGGRGIAADQSTGELFVATGKEVVRFSASGRRARAYAVPATGLLLDGDQLTVVDGATVRQLDVRSGAVRVVATIPDVQGLPRDNPPSLHAAARNIAGELFVSDQGQGVVWKVGAAPEVFYDGPELLSPDGSGPVGMAFEGDDLVVAVSRSVVALTGAVYRISGGAATEVWRSEPDARLTGLAIDDGGRIYVAASGPNQVVVLDGGAVVTEVASPDLVAPFGLAVRGASVLATGTGKVTRLATGG